MERERDSFRIIYTGFLLSIVNIKREIEKKREKERERERERGKRWREKEEKERDREFKKQ